jgi:hypothetical protein
MTAGAQILPYDGLGSSKANSLTWPIMVIVLLAALQFSLIFSKSLNWDEFLHYSMVYQLQEGTLARPFQTLLARLLFWVPNASVDLIEQMLAARVAIWCAFLIGLYSLYGLARQFVSPVDAAWTTLAYLGAGSVFAHGFAIRTDPIAMAMLMSALYLLASRPVGWVMLLAVGALAGFSGALTVKAIFYAPCFAGIAWLRLTQTHDKRGTLVWILGVVPVAVVTFAMIHIYHRAGLAPVAAVHDGSSFVANGMKWLTEGLFRQPDHILAAFLTAPLFVYAAIRSPAVWKSGGLSAHQKIALVGLSLPLLTILFYRNTFPYFFVFILAPAAVALAPAVAAIRARYGNIILAAAVCTIPLAKAVAEPREVIDHQRALVDYVHRQFPGGALSLDYCGMIADYPRVIDHLISGIGVANYNKRGVALVAEAVDRGELDFVIDNKPAIANALAGISVPGELLPADVAALHGNYVRIWGSLWLAGEQVPAGNNPVMIEVPHAAVYTSDRDVVIDGKAYRRNEPLELGKGSHIVDGTRTGRTILWRGSRLPVPPPTTIGDSLFTNF